MSGHGVIIVGAGPTGLMLGAELRLAGVDAVIVERRPDRVRIQPGALGLHARTIEVFDQRGIAGRFLAEGTPMQVMAFAGVRLDISAFPTRHPYGLAIPQRTSERILADWVEELGVAILRGSEFAEFNETSGGLDVKLADGRVLRTQYLVGCDGGRSSVRKAAGIAFPGSDPTVSHLLAEAEYSGAPEWGLRKDRIGIHALNRTADGKAGILVTERAPGGGEPTLDLLREALFVHYGNDFGIRDPTYITRFTDMTRQAETYRKGRVLLAGDAAHIHYPAGGFGMGLGIQDAVNMGWKLGEVVAGRAPDTLLDTYHAERHPVAERLMRYTLASVALNRAESHIAALNGVVGELVAMAEPSRVTAGRMSGLDILYGPGEGHPLVGRRMPDMELATGSDHLRTYALLHDARPLLLDLATPGVVTAGAWSDRVRSVAAICDAAWDLPVIGAVPAPAAVLIRPDGYVAWVGQGPHDGLAAALTTWFGPR